MCGRRRKRHLEMNRTFKTIWLLCCLISLSVPAAAQRPWPQLGGSEQRRTLAKRSLPELVRAMASDDTWAGKEQAAEALDIVCSPCRNRNRASLYIHVYEKLRRMGMAGAEHDIAMITSYPDYYLALFERDTTMLDMLDRATGIGAVCASGLCDESIVRMNRALDRQAGRHAVAVRRFGRCVELTAASLRTARSVVTDITEPAAAECRFVGIDSTAFEHTGVPAAMLCGRESDADAPAALVGRELLRRNGSVYREMDASLGNGVRCIDCADDLARWIVIVDVDDDTLTLPAPVYVSDDGRVCAVWQGALLLARITGDGRIDSRCTVPLPQGAIESVRYDEETIAVEICAPDGAGRCYRLCIGL